MTPETRNGIKCLAAIITDEVALVVFLRGPRVAVPEPRTARRTECFWAVRPWRLAPGLLVRNLAPSAPPVPPVAKPLVAANADHRVKLLGAKRTHVLAVLVLEWGGDMSAAIPAATAGAQRPGTVGPVELPPRCLRRARTPLAPPRVPIADPLVTSQPPDALKLLVASLAYVHPLRVLGWRMGVPVAEPIAYSDHRGLGTDLPTQQYPPCTTHTSTRRQPVLLPPSSCASSPSF
eukprot:CAMPEP_0172033476 /NCGR_PEP_ID=MMETSP1041-20130122/20478_1 /TAXON_ID=464988 /ORGANISM="Hemiselmis andersenii, Strain CCMP439" /LENGTH=233 /DNA_ID=CAMNT_0012690295 /DNA_START=817 /DNA_END=1518 /DNA_ORIENTATION=+